MREQPGELSSISELFEPMSNRKRGECRRQTEPGVKLNKGRAKRIQVEFLSWKRHFESRTTC